MAAPFVFVWYMFYADQLWVKFVRRGHWLVILFYILMYLVIGKVYDAFRISYNSKGEMIYSQALSLLEVNVFMYIVEWLLIRHAPRVLPMIGVYVVQLGLAALWSHVAQNWYFKTFPANKTVIIWDVRQGISNLIEKYDLKKKFRVVGDMSVEQCLANLSILDNVDTVFIVGVHSHERNIIAKYCLMHDIKAFLIPKIGDLIVTCTSAHSRNWNAGYLIGKGVPVKDAMERVHQVVEGVYSAKAALKLAEEKHVEMPIVEEMNQVLFDNKDARQAATDLLTRDKRVENNNLSWD